MIHARAALSRRYHADLQQFLKQGPSASTAPARTLGQLAVDNGLETLDVARIHEIAIASLILPTYSPDTSRVQLSRAAAFFAEALVPIERTHRGATEANIRLNYTIKALGQRTDELADSVSELKLEVVQRTEAQAALKLSERTTSALLVKSLEMQSQLRHLTRELLSVQEEERRKISRELHDVIAQSLSSINFRLAELKSDTALNHELLTQKIEVTQRLVETSVEIVHRFARELRPSVLDDLGLIPALEAHFKSYLQETGIRVKLTVSRNVDHCPMESLTVIFRIVQEALANVARHAQTSAAEVRIVDLNGTLCLEVTDHGIGFKAEGKSCATKTIRLGLLGMKERAEMIGGSFSITSAPGQGTIIRVLLPPLALPTTIPFPTPDQQPHEPHHHSASRRS